MVLALWNNKRPVYTAESEEHLREYHKARPLKHCDLVYVKDGSRMFVVDGDQVLEHKGPKPMSSESKIVSLTNLKSECGTVFDLKSSVPPGAEVVVSALEVSCHGKWLKNGVDFIYLGSSCKIEMFIDCTRLTINIPVKLPIPWERFLESRGARTFPLAADPNKFKKRKPVI